MSSYWTRKRKVDINVDNHITAIEIENACSSKYVQNTETDLDLNYVDYLDNSLHNSEGIHLCESQNNIPTNDANQPSHTLNTCSVESDFELAYYSSSDTDSESEFVDRSNCDLLDQLSEWAVKFQVSNIALSVLLSILRPFHPELPKDPRTLLNTKTSYNIIEISGGQYYHFGIKNTLRDLLAINKYIEDNHIRIQINIDGLPLFKSTNHQFWPILGKVDNIKDCGEPFVIGIFYGISKPHKLSEYLKNLIEELNQLHSEGILIDGEHYHISVSAVICDAPAKAFVKNVKQYSGYHGCDKCIQNGVWMGKMTFPETGSALRSNKAFDEMSDEDHHKGPSPFTDTNIGMISQFPIDYMHLVCLGVVKRLLHLWLKGPLKTRIGGQVTRQISSSLVRMRDYIPSEFSRKPRSLDDIERWKATEFRQFLLYTGPVVLVNSLHEIIYKNFLLLSVGLHILLNSFLCQQYNDYGHNLLVAFVEHFGQLYGKDMLVYNVHGLVHLAGDAHRHGSLDNISSFPFENFLCKLKKMIRKPSYPLQQVVRRLSEKRYDLLHKHNYPVLKKQHYGGPVPDALIGCKQFRAVQTEQFVLAPKRGDNCIRIENQVCLLRNIIEQKFNTFVVYSIFKNVQNFFETPLKSQLLGIYLVSDLDDEIYYQTISKVQAKCVLLPLNEVVDSYVAIPFTDQVWAVYSVVEFTDDMDVAIVPTAWMVGKTKCMWPVSWKSSTKLEKAVRSCQDPDDTFVMYDVRKLYESDNYSKVRSKLKSAEFTSDLQTEAEDADIVPPKRQRRQNMRFISESEPDSSPEKTVKRKSTVEQERKRPATLPELQLPPPPMPTLSFNPIMPASTLTTDASPATRSSVTSLFDTRSPSPARPPVTEKDRRMLTLLEEVKTQTYFNTKLIQIILKKIDKTAEEQNRDNMDLDKLPDTVQLPLKTLEELDSLESRLEDKDFMKQMIANMGTVGGDTIPSCVRRILKYLMTNNIAMKFNWMGKGNKRAFSSLAIMSLISKSVRKNRLTENATDSEIGNITKDWLRYASDREGGRKKRQDAKRRESEINVANVANEANDQQEH